jgi:hypothetical protein
MKEGEAVCYVAQAVLAGLFIAKVSCGLTPAQGKARVVGYWICFLSTCKPLGGYQEILETSAPRTFGICDADEPRRVRDQH